jgi:hypothetical protein
MLADIEWKAAPQETHPAVIRMNGKATTRIFRQVDIGRIRKEARSRSVTELATEYGVSYRTMYNIVRGLSYRSLNLIYPPQW